MKSKRFAVHYANFVCHFGTEELLDYLQEIVMPAFLTPDSMRTFKDGKYFFNDVSILNFALPGQPPEPAICGRFIKDMVVKSEQRWDAEAGELLAVSQRLETAPSAVFVLLLSSHKLIYLLETANAPGLASFRTTVEHFLKRSRLAYLDDIFQRSAQDRLTPDEYFHFHRFDNTGAPERITKKLLNELLGPVDLEVVPLSNEESLRQFLDRFETLQAATLKLVKPNSELDNDDFIEGFRSKSDAVGSKTSSIVYRNPEGLNKSKVAGQLEVAAKDANVLIRLDGKGQGQQPLSGSNHEFKVISYLVALPSGVKSLAGRMIALFREQRGAGLISTGDAKLTDKAKALLAALAASAGTPPDEQTHI